ncbi:MAG: nucleotidyltransferase domain-containing protein, partial [Alphaproteobacteria bacterium]|nr:nucleotidyltransferase domain-containing protein [Alphaproteobacteria bacterium]
MIDKLDLLSLNIKEINNLFQVKFELLKAEFLKSGYRYDSGSKFQSKYTNLIDKTVYDIADACFQGSKAASAPVIVALGGYGRKELAPHSDIDIVFIHEHPSNQQTKKFIESLNSHFWNIGMKLSASARTLQDCESGMSKDVMFLTSLLEKRHIWGP